MAGINFDHVPSASESINDITPKFMGCLFIPQQPRPQGFLSSTFNSRREEVLWSSLTLHKLAIAKAHLFYFQLIYITSKSRVSRRDPHSEGIFSSEKLLQDEERKAFDAQRATCNRSQ